ncbi:MAG: AAA family ATPase [Alkalibacterium sp.]|nr:AAA family ATPase [Alkalibacterium sp.]
MQLKRLEIKGFKSFADKTIIDFTDGITAVVGPNGSGKSNIIEAIRWVMVQSSRPKRCAAGGCMTSSSQERMPEKRSISRKSLLF